MSKGREVFRAAILVGVLLGVSSNNKAEATAMADSDCLDAVVTWIELATVATAAWVESGGTFGVMSAAAAVATYESTKAYGAMAEACDNGGEVVLAPDNYGGDRTWRIWM